MTAQDPFYSCSIPKNDETTQQERESRAIYWLVTYLENSEQLHLTLEDFEHPKHSEGTMIAFYSKEKTE